MPRSTPTRLAAAAGLGYVAGMFPSASLAAKVAGAGDIRELGTGNPGAANAINELGTRWGAVVLVADVAKGALAGAAGRRLAGDLGAHAGSVAAVAGHCYPVTSGFDGGKGVATSVGQCIATFPPFLVPNLALAGVTSALPWWKQRAYGATAVAAAVWTGAAVVWWRRDLPNWWGPAPTAALPLAVAATSGMIIQRFAANTHKVDAASSRPAD